MKTISISLTEIEYTQLRLLIEDQIRILLKRKELLNGTKSIPANLVVCGFLKDRYLMKYDADKLYQGYGNYRDFKMEIYQVAALSYFLDDAVDIPYHLDIFNKANLKNIISKYQQVTIKDDFQNYYEAELMEEYDITFTELRDERPYLYDILYKRFNTIHSET